MTFDIAFVLVLLGLSLLLFATGWVRMDVVALLVLCALAVPGFVSPGDAVAGFGNPAVITVWAMFILSEGLTRAGIADRISRSVLGCSGRSGPRTVAVLTLVSGVLSAFMSNIAVAALMLPVAIEVARRTALPASLLLMPIALGAQLGGMTTLIGTPPNLLLSSALESTGAQGFSMLDFAWLGVPILLAGTAFLALAARRILPDTDTTDLGRDQRALRATYGLAERILALRVPGDSVLVGRTIGASGLQGVAGLLIIALKRDGRTEALPGRETTLRGGDVLIAQGRLDRFTMLRNWASLEIVREAPVLHEKLLERTMLAEIMLVEGSALIGQRFNHREFRERFGINVLAVDRSGRIRHSALPELVLAADDRLLVQGPPEAMSGIEQSGQFGRARPVTPDVARSAWSIAEQLFVLRVPADSPLVDTSFGDNRLGDAFDFRLLGLFRKGEVLEFPASDERISQGDLLLVQGREADLDLLRGLQQLEHLDGADSFHEVFEYGQLDLVEASLHPHSKLIGQAADALQLDERYRVRLAAIWREGRPHRSALGAMNLQAGDALLIVGPRERLARLNDNHNLVLLNPVQTKPIDSSKAPLAGALMLTVVILAATGLVPVHLAALCGVVAMVLSGCLNMEQAYRAIEWRSIFLMAGMLPLGTAMHETGAAAWIARNLVELFADTSPWTAIAGLYAITVAGVLVIPPVALVLILAPIALSLSSAFGFPPQTAMMAIAVAATSLASPVSHPANTLVMGPGGYRFADYLRLGGLLTLIAAALTALLLPVFWPLQPPS